jgi:hypothetical protein
MWRILYWVAVVGVLLFFIVPTTGAMYVVASLFTPKLGITLPEWGLWALWIVTGLAVIGVAERFQPDPKQRA